MAARDEPSLEAFCRAAVTAGAVGSDVETYLTCPLRYKFAGCCGSRASRRSTSASGSSVHQVLERFHGTGGGGSEEMMRLLEIAWRRGGFSDSDEDVSCARRPASR